jgi:hypothetical protein
MTTYISRELARDRQDEVRRQLERAQRHRTDRNPVRHRTRRWAARTHFATAPWAKA